MGEGSGDPASPVERGRRLREVRGARHQRDFARRLGVSQQAVSAYERGAPPSGDFLIALALREGVSLNWLLLGQGRRKAPRTE